MAIIIGTSGSNMQLLPPGTTAERPASPSVGQLRYNTQNGVLEGYGASWNTIANLGISWAAFYDFRQTNSATTAYRYDNSVTSSPGETATYSNAALIRRTVSISGSTCAGIAHLYTASLTYARMATTVNYPNCTIMQIVYKPAGGFDPNFTGGLLSLGFNFGNSSWNVQTDSYRDGATTDGYAFTIGSGYTAAGGTRYRNTAWPTAAGIYTLFTVYDGTNVYRYINAGAGDTVSATPYITITPGTGAVTFIGVLDATNFGSNYNDGATFWSCAAVWNKVLTPAQMTILATNRIKLASDTTYFGTI